MNFVTAWLRLELPRRWRSITVLMLVIAVASGTVMASLAGARRGASALERMYARTLPATSAVFTNTANYDWNKIRALPEVAAVTTFVIDYAYAFEGYSILAGHKFHAILVSLRPGADVEATVAALAKATEAAIPEAAGFAFRPLALPVEVAETKIVRSRPIVLGGFLALLIANLLAAIPGRRAARLHICHILRTE